MGVNGSTVRWLVRGAEGLISSFACTVSGGAYQIVQDLKIDDFSRGKIDTSVAELVEEREAVRTLGLID